MKTLNTLNEKIANPNFEMISATKRINWNSRRRYAVLTHYKFI